MQECSPQSHDPRVCYGASRGFTLVEIIIAVAIIGILTAIAIPSYKSYIDKAKITLAISTLETTRKNLEDYHINYTVYPAVIDFSTGLDGQGRAVFTSELVSEMKKNLFTVDSYTPAPEGYTITSRAQDSTHTLLTLTASGVVSVSH